MPCRILLSSGKLFVTAMINHIPTSGLRPPSFLHGGLKLLTAANYTTRIQRGLNILHLITTTIPHYFTIKFPGFLSNFRNFIGPNFKRSGVIWSGLFHCISLFGFTLKRGYACLPKYMIIPA